MKKLPVFILLCSLFFSTCYSAYPTYNGPYSSEEKQVQTLPNNSDANKCYVRTVTLDVFIYYSKNYQSYSSQEAHLYPHRTVLVELKPKLSRWEYSKYKGCTSNDPGDCQVLCWREYPALIDTIWMPVDSTLGNPYVKTLKITELYEKGGLETWTEIDCELLEYNNIPICFSSSSSDLGAKDKDVVEGALLSLLRENPGLRIEISGHTNAIGTKIANQELSKQRALSVVNYLIEKGIAANRLMAVGYGESRPKNHCRDEVECIDEEHAVNERVEFRVLN